MVVFPLTFPAMVFANIVELKRTLPVRLLNICPDLRVSTEVKILRFSVIQCQQKKPKVSLSFRIQYIVHF